jgi:hypothetical protein
MRNKIRCVDITAGNYTIEGVILQGESEMTTVGVKPVSKRVSLPRINLGEIVRIALLVGLIYTLAHVSNLKGWWYGSLEVGLRYSIPIPATFITEDFQGKLSLLEQYFLPFIMLWGLAVIKIRSLSKANLVIALICLVVAVKSLEYFSCSTIWFSAQEYKFVKEMLNSAAQLEMDRRHHCMVFALIGIGTSMTLFLSISIGIYLPFNRLESAAKNRVRILRKGNSSQTTTEEYSDLQATDENE